MSDLVRGRMLVVAHGGMALALLFAIYVYDRRAGGLRIRRAMLVHRSCSRCASDFRLSCGERGPGGSGALWRRGDRPRDRYRRAVCLTLGNGQRLNWRGNLADLLLLEILGLLAVIAADWAGLSG